MQQRTCQRFTVPDATVDWVAVADPRLRGADCPAPNLSRGGARFLSEGPPRLGTPLRLRISLPGEPDIPEVRARIVWSLLSSGRTYHVGVEFAPYGRGTDANDPAILERLTALEARFLRSDA